MSRELIIVDLAKGIYQFATLPSEMDTWPTGPLRWSVGYTRNPGDTVMLWTDQNYSPYSNLVVIETPTPGPKPTAVMAWTDFSPLTGANSNYWPPTPTSYYSSSLPGAAQYGYSNGMQTAVARMDNFTGIVRLEATLIAEPNPDSAPPGSPDWFTVMSRDYTAFTGLDTLDQIGNYLWMRVVVTPMTGSMIEVAYRV